MNTKTSVALRYPLGYIVRVLTDKEKEKMSYKDIEVRLTGITPRNHVLRYNSSGNRIKYPFKAMIVGDYIEVHTQTEALSIRNALKSFYKRIGGRRFTVRQTMEDDSVWICRRVS